MNQNIPPIIESAALLKLYKSDFLVLIDARSGKNAKANYGEKHLEGALFVDLEKQLAEIKEDASNGGRHPLPKIENFAKTLSDLGISEKSHVVIYDDKNGANAAARFWWMLKAVGHEKVQVLDGGLQAAEKSNFPTSAKTEIITKAALYKVDNWKLPITTIGEVETVSQDKNHIVIDVRETSRYNGETEPIDLIAGHIPGAINIPFTENLDENGLFLPPTELKEKYSKIFENVKPENIIVHCGSGVTACHSLLAIAYAKLEIPKLYVGSWSEWSRNGKKIKTKT
jgi:thiosulfate/3-mercaptopyruvate sulfurtransferase